MNKKVLFSILLVPVVLGLVGCTGYLTVDDLEDPNTVKEKVNKEVKEEDTKLDIEEPIKEVEDYQSIMGRIKDLNKDRIIIEVDNEDGEIKEVTLLNVYDKNLEELKSDYVIAYAEHNQPQTMEFPESFRFKYIFEATPDKIQKLARFNEDLVSEDGMLKLMFEEDIEEEQYKDKLLYVEYDVSTKSIPAITSPYMVVVAE